MKNRNQLFKILLIINILCLSGVVKSQTNDSLIGKIIAYDPDTAQTLTYEIIEGNEENIFFLDSNTGFLYWRNKPFGIIRPKSYVLIVKVTDNGTPPLSSKATCTVQYVP